MTPHDHNRMLALTHGLVGILFLVGLTVVLVVELREVARPVSAAKVPKDAYLLAIPLLQLATAYGLFRQRRWARMLALGFCALYVFVFPLGTLLAVYTCWFMYSEGGKQLYGRGAS